MFVGDGELDVRAASIGRGRAGQGEFVDPDLGGDDLGDVLGDVVERRRGSALRIRSRGGVVVRRYEVLHLPDDGLRMTLWLPPE